MKPADLNRAVARATGEPVDRVARMGFTLIVMPVRLKPPIRLRRQAPRRVSCPVLTGAPARVQHLA